MPGFTAINRAHSKSRPETSQLMSPKIIKPKPSAPRIHPVNFTLTIPRRQPPSPKSILSSNTSTKPITLASCSARKQKSKESGSTSQTLVDRANRGSQVWQGCDDLISEEWRKKLKKMIDGSIYETSDDEKREQARKRRDRKERDERRRKKDKAEVRNGTQDDCEGFVAGDDGVGPAEQEEAPTEESSRSQLKRKLEDDDKAERAERKKARKERKERKEQRRLVQTDRTVEPREDAVVEDHEDPTLLNAEEDERLECDEDDSQDLIATAESSKANPVNPTLAATANPILRPESSPGHTTRHTYHGLGTPEVPIMFPSPIRSRSQAEQQESEHSGMLAEMSTPRIKPKNKRSRRSRGHSVISSASRHDGTSKFDLRVGSRVPATAPHSTDQIFTRRRRSDEPSAVVNARELDVNGELQVEGARAKRPDTNEQRRENTGGRRKSAQKHHDRDISSEPASDSGSDYIPPSQTPTEPSSEEDDVVSSDEQHPGFTYGPEPDGELEWYERKCRNECRAQRRAKIEASRRTRQKLRGRNSPATPASSTTRADSLDSMVEPKDIRTNFDIDAAIKARNASAQIGVQVEGPANGAGWTRVLLTHRKRGLTAAEYNIPAQMQSEGHMDKPPKSADTMHNTDAGSGAEMFSRAGADPKVGCIEAASHGQQGRAPEKPAQSSRQVTESSAAPEPSQVNYARPAPRIIYERSSQVIRTSRPELGVRLGQQSRLSSSPKFSDAKPGPTGRDGPSARTEPESRQETSPKSNVGTPTATQRSGSARSDSPVEEATLHSSPPLKDLDYEVWPEKSTDRPWEYSDDSTALPPSDEPEHDKADTYPKAARGDSIGPINRSSSPSTDQTTSVEVDTAKSSNSGEALLTTNKASWQELVAAHTGYMDMVKRLQSSSPQERIGIDVVLQAMCLMVNHMAEAYQAQNCR